MNSEFVRLRKGQRIVGNQIPMRGIGPSVMEFTRSMRAFEFGDLARKFAQRVAFVTASTRVTLVPIHDDDR